KLKYRGGLRLSTADSRFGGWSGLRVAEDGRSVMLLSDNGYWLEGRLVHHANRNPKGVAETPPGPLLDNKGKVVSRRPGDAEGLAPGGGGGWGVSFEGEHRLWFYPRAEPPFSKPPTPLPSPPGFDKMPGNGGVEALVSLPDGDLLALAEDLYENNLNVGWI